MGVRYGGIIHAEGVALVALGAKQYHPRRRRVVWFSIIRAEGAHRELVVKDSATDLRC